MRTAHESLRRSGAAFTLIELVSVIVILAVLAGVAVPRYIDYGVRARKADMEGTMGALRSAVAMAPGAYALGEGASLPPDANDDGFPDHLGETSKDVDTLFSGVLDLPIRNAHDEAGWKPHPTLAFPFSGNIYVYIYDTDGDNALDLEVDGYVLYWGATGRLVTWVPPNN